MTKVRFTAVFLLLSVVFSMCLPLAVSAEETGRTDSLYAEPTILCADDNSECVTGFNIYVENPDNLALTLAYAIYREGDAAGSITDSNDEDYRDWVNITKTAPPAEDTETETEAETTGTMPFPAFIVDFCRPGDIAVADAEYIDTPAFLRASTVSGGDIYSLAPGLSIAFRVVGGEAGEDGAYPLDYTTTYTLSPDVVTFALERPSKLIVQLTQNENESGSLDIDVSIPESVRRILMALRDDKEAFLQTYSLADANMYIQFDYSRLDVPSSYSPEEEADMTAIWDSVNLESIPLEDLNSFLSVQKPTYSFDDEVFRSRFPEGTFTEITVPVETEAGETLAEGASAERTCYVINTETITLTTRARFVLALTAADGTIYYNTTEFTDPFSCGASNSLVSEPSSINAPVLSEPVFETDEDGDKILTFQVQSNDSVRDTAFWLSAYDGKGAVGFDLDISFDGGEWESYEDDFIAVPDPTRDGDFVISVPGEELNEYVYIRVRLRYSAEGISLQSEWSDALAFDIKPEEVVTAPATGEALPLYTEDTAGDGELKYVCPICGICPGPYGVCLFLWIGAALLIVLLVVLIIALIPKKMYCPRCNAPCRHSDRSCPVCGYRFVGNMPEIEDTTEEINIPDNTKDDAFFAETLAENLPKTATHDNTPPVTETPKPTAASAAAEQTAASASGAAPDAAFLAELKRKMTAVKAGQKPSFTPAEIAYIRRLKEKSAKSAAPAVQPAPVQPPEPKAAEPQTNTPAQTNHPRYTPEQLARLREIRAKQLAEEKAKTEAAAKETPAAPKKVEKPVRQIKCPACAVPNPETNGQCYICGTRLK